MTTPHAPRARLFAKTGPAAGQSFKIEGEATIGRSADNQVTLPEGVVSSRHGRIFYEADQEAFFIEDLGSRNGTWVDGVRVREPERLDRLHVLSFAETYDFLFQVVEDEEAPSPAAGHTMIDEIPEGLPAALVGDAPPESPDRPHAAPVTMMDSAEAFELPTFDDVEEPDESEEPEEDTHVTPQAQAPTRPPTPQPPGPPKPPSPPRPPAPDPPSPQPPPTPSPPPKPQPPPSPGPGRPGPKSDSESASKSAPGATLLLVVRRKDHPPRTFELEEGETFLGRSTGCRVSLEDPTLSRRHAKLTVRGGKVWVADLGSTNESFVDGEALQPRTDVEIRPGKKLRFGSVEAELQIWRDTP